MKKILLPILLLLMTGATAFAQSPQKFNYQGIARNTTGAPLISQPIGMRFTIHDGSSGGTVVYQETQTSTTNAFGLYIVSIGDGTVVSGTFSSISWAGGTKYLQVELDPTGGTSYVDAGTSQLISVPYAQYATTAASAGTATSAGSITGTVPMSGDVTGTNAAATVARLQGKDVSTTAPTAGQVLQWNSGSSSWTPATLASGGSVTSITASAPLTGGTITTSGTIGLGTVGAASTYGDASHYPTFTTDAYGRVTAVTVNTFPASAGVTGSGTTNYISKFTSPTAIGNSLMFDNGTSVGLGTTSPVATYKLHVINPATTSGNYAVRGLLGTAPSTSVTTPGGLYGESSTGIGVIGVSSGQNGMYAYSTASGYAGLAAYNPTAGGYGVWSNVSGAGSIAGNFDGGASGYGVVVGNGNSGFGIAAPTAKVYVNGSSDLSATLGSVLFGHQAFISSTSATSTSNVSRAIIGYTGNSTIENQGLFGYANGGGSSANVAVFGLASPPTTTTGTCYSFYGNAIGGASNYGVYGNASGGTTNVGIYGSGSSSGVYGYGGSIGVYGTATNTGTTLSATLVPIITGVAGVTRAVTSGYPSGLYGGVSYPSAAGTAGVIALSDSNTTANYGVYAYAAHGGGVAANYGVYASTDGTGSMNYAGYFAGYLYATSASSSIKSFKIDDPRDPANKYLYHSSVESNEMMNLYKGHVVTDANGDAIATLPSYFMALNMDFEYQLTCIGQFAQAIVAEKISDNHFRIKTDKPNVEVSWMVSGVRNDAIANKYRIQDEVEKPAAEKGTYLVPEAYGFGPEMAPGYKTSPAYNHGQGDAKVFPAAIKPSSPDGSKATTR